MDALGRLLSKKDFEDISVQEIADETTLNRATFYLLYPDKNQSSRNDKREGVSQLHSRTEALINQCLENGGMPISSIQE
jgi:AcrR family transcriptional regulator